MNAYLFITVLVMAIAVGFLIALMWDAHDSLRQMKDSLADLKTNFRLQDRAVFDLTKEIHYLEDRWRKIGYQQALDDMGLTPKRDSEDDYNREGCGDEA